MSRPGWKDVSIRLDDVDVVCRTPDELQRQLTPLVDTVIALRQKNLVYVAAKIRLGRAINQIRAILGREAVMRYVQPALRMNRKTLYSCTKLAARWAEETADTTVDAQAIEILRAKAILDLRLPHDHPIATQSAHTMAADHLEVMLGIRPMREKTRKSGAPDFQQGGLLGSSDPQQSQYAMSTRVDIGDDAFSSDGVDSHAGFEGLDDEDDDLPPPLGYTREGVEIITREDIDHAEEDGDITPAVAAQYRAQLARREEDDGGQDPADYTRAGAVVDGGDPDRLGVVARDYRQAGDVDRGAHGDLAGHVDGPTERLVPPAAHRLSLVSDQAAGPANGDGRVRAGAAVSGALKRQCVPATQLTLGALYEHADNLRKVAARAVDAMRSGDRGAASGSLAELRDLVQALEREVA